jgi:hypothetical protein
MSDIMRRDATDNRSVIQYITNAVGAGYVGRNPA